MRRWRRPGLRDDPLTLAVTNRGVCKSNPAGGPRPGASAGDGPGAAGRRKQEA